MPPFSKIRAAPYEFLSLRSQFSLVQHLLGLSEMLVARLQHDLFQLLEVATQRPQLRQLRE
eukprot:6032790-Pyramimonas_sp.AAC.1